MTKPYEKAIQRANEVYDSIANQEDLSMDESFMFLSEMSKITLKVVFTVAAYATCKNPNYFPDLEGMKKDILSLIEDAIEEGNERYEKELN